MRQLPLPLLHTRRSLLPLLDLPFCDTKLHLLAPMYSGKRDRNRHVRDFPAGDFLAEGVEYQCELGCTNVCIHVDCDSIFSCGLDCALPFGMFESQRAEREEEA